MNLRLGLPAWLMERPKRWAHLRSAPARQVTHLMLALFLLFSVFGFYNDLIAGGTAPFMIVLANAALSGAIAVAWLLTIEVCSPNGIEFGIEALEGLLRTNAAAPLALLAESIFAAARAYGKQQDDQTLLLVRRTAAAPSLFPYAVLRGDMKHASEAALERIQPVLLELRQLEGIKERKPGIFYRKSSALIHFHEDPAGIFADVSRDREWLRLPLNRASERRQFVRLVKEILDRGN
jgi:hypothetical protein